MDNVNALHPAALSPNQAAGRSRDAFATRFLRLEGLILLLASALAYRHLGGGWAIFAALFLVPDLSLFGYVVGPRFGAWIYNAGHSTLLPAVLALAGFVLGAPLCVLLALIWTAHIGFDRLLGYGLKQLSGFRDTHLGRIGAER